MRFGLFLLFIIVVQVVRAQSEDYPAKLNTAQNESYLLAGEKEMIAEINYMRSEPKEYVQFLLPLLKHAKIDIETGHQSSSGFSYTKFYKTVNGVSELDRIDTVYYNESEAEYKALTELVERLKSIEPLSILKPDRGIYKALKAHEKDQSPTGNVDHFGVDKSWPSDRILKHSPTMTEGGENIACGNTSVRDIVIMLAIDSGISSRGHRETLLNPSWTHVSCRFVGELENGMPCNWWIQNFGKKGARK